MGLITNRPIDPDTFSTDGSKVRNLYLGVHLSGDPAAFMRNWQSKHPARVIGHVSEIPAAFEALRFLEDLSRACGPRCCREVPIPAGRSLVNEAQEAGYNPKDL